MPFETAKSIVETLNGVHKRSAMQCLSPDNCNDFHLSGTVQQRQRQGDKNSMCSGGAGLGRHFFHFLSKSDPFFL